MEEINKLKKILSSFKWKNAKTYIKFNHDYVVRNNENKEDFDFVVNFIEKNGVIGNFFRKKYKYIYLLNYKFWYIEDVINREYFYHFGEHLMFDCYECEYSKLNDYQNVYNFLDEAVNLLGMKKLTDIVVKEAKPKIKDPGGYSGFVVIEESHISTHTFSKRLFNTIDFYSCKDAIIYKKQLTDLINKYFNPKKIDFYFIIRGKTYPKENIL